MKPVVVATIKNAFDYEFQSRYPSDPEKWLASNSLYNLKKIIRENTGWRLAWITTKTGCFSVGQTCVDEYPYRPSR